MRTFTLGCIFAIPNAANPTPIPIASAKGIKATTKQAKKQFRGNQRDVIDVGDGARDWTIEIESADFRTSTYQMVVGGTLSSPGILPAIAEPGTIAAGAVAVANGASFREDGGVYDLTIGQFLTRVASAPAVKQYTPGASYAFNVSDNGHAVLITYGYNTAGTVGQLLSVSNSMQSQSTAFKLRAYNPWPVNGSMRLVGRDYYSVHFEELSEDFKDEDFAAFSLKGFASQDMIGVTAKTCDFWMSELG